MRLRKLNILSLTALKTVARKKAKIQRQISHDKIGYEASQKVSVHIERFLLNRPKLSVIAVYMPIKTELDLGPTIIKLRRLGKKICLPLIISKDNPLQFKVWNEDSKLVPGKFNVLVPVSEEIVEPDLILCPMLSFDSSGFRLGYGGGFYDRTIDYLSKRKTILTMGCGYSQQLSQKFLPKGVYDKSLDTIVTERGVTFFGK
jgi:5-formyltetrahydrofolate cyclo-ligase